MLKFPLAGDLKAGKDVLIRGYVLDSPFLWKRLLSQDTFLYHLCFVPNSLTIKAIHRTKAAAVLQLQLLLPLFPDPLGGELKGASVQGNQEP